MVRIFKSYSCRNLRFSSQITSSLFLPQPLVLPALQLVLAALHMVLAALHSVFDARKLVLDAHCSVLPALQLVLVARHLELVARHLVLDAQYSANHNKPCSNHTFIWESNTLPTSHQTKLLFIHALLKVINTNLFFKEAYASVPYSICAAKHSKFIFEFHAISAVYTVLRSNKNVFIRCLKYRTSVLRNIKSASSVLI